MSWLDERVDEPESEATMASTLADMAWTAGIGRSHFPHRAGVPFKDLASLRDRLSTLAEKGTSDDAAEPRQRAGLHSCTPAREASWLGRGREVYDTEPAARAVLDFCDAVVQQERGVSLLDVVFGRDGAGGSLDDPLWAEPALYSLQCALTALWSGIGVRPFAVLGDGVGELSAAQAAGVFSLEGGLRFVLARGEIEVDDPDLASLQTALDGIQLSPPTAALVSRAKGGVSAPYAPKDMAFWVRQTREAAPLEERLSDLADLGVDAVIHIGLDWALDREMILHHLDSPVVLPTNLHQAEDGFPGFAAFAAEAYEAGLTVSFDGLFTGESRRRISLPSYPFQRRRHWV